MAAINWISFRAVCPVCRAQGEMRAQCHVASSHDGDERGRFHDHRYALGSPMCWWPRGDARWRNWVDGADPKDAEQDRVLECCYAHCDRCGANLFAVIEFVDATPSAVLEIGVEDDWPERFSR